MLHRMFSSFLKMIEDVAVCNLQLKHSEDGGSCAFLQQTRHKKHILIFLTPDKTFHQQPSHTLSSLPPFFPPFSPPQVLQSALHRIRHGRTGSRLANLHCQHQHVSMWPRCFILISNDNDNEFHFRSIRVHSALRLHRLIAASSFHSITANEKGEMKGRPTPTLLPLLHPSHLLPFNASPSPLIPMGIQGEKISSEIKFRLI